MGRFETTTTMATRIGITISIIKSVNTCAVQGKQDVNAAYRMASLMMEFRRGDNYIAELRLA